MTLSARRNLDFPKLRTSDQILQVALAKKKEARDFYDKQVHCGVEFVRRLLETFKDEESKHIRMVQAMTTKLSVGRDIVRKLKFESNLLCSSF